MRVTVVVIGLIAIGTFLVATAPTSAAVGYCVRDVKEPLPYDDCDGLVCVGHSNNHWQTCLPPGMDCLHGVTCPCYYDIEPGGYYCA